MYIYIYIYIYIHLYICHQAMQVIIVNMGSILKLKIYIQEQLDGHIVFAGKEQQGERGHAMCSHTKRKGGQTST